MWVINTFRGHLMAGNLPEDTYTSPTNRFFTDPKSPATFLRKLWIEVSADLKQQRANTSPFSPQDICTLSWIIRSLSNVKPQKVWEIFTYYMLRSDTIKKPLSLIEALINPVFIGNSIFGFSLELLMKLWQNDIMVNNGDFLVIWK